MFLTEKPDLEAALARAEAWWEGAIVDRPPVTLQVRPDRPPDLPESRHATVRDRWMDIAFRIERAEARMAVTPYLAETFPNVGPNVGPDVCSTVFGCDLVFEEGTTYSTPVVHDCRAILDLRPDFDTPYWSAVRALADLSLERSRGRWWTALPDLHTGSDLVAALRDPQGMALDMALDLDGVRAACDHVQATSYERFVEDIHGRLRAAGQPVTFSWIPFPHAGLGCVVQADVICLVSPAMFREALLPSIAFEVDRLDRSIFHLDGPGALRHLDALMELDGLDAVQWVCGAGGGDADDWTDVYRRIQAGGKGIDLAGTPRAVQAVCEHLRPEGVWLRPYGPMTRDEADAFVAWTERWAAGKS